MAKARTSKTTPAPKSAMSLAVDTLPKSRGTVFQVEGTFLPETRKVNVRASDADAARSFLVHTMEKAMRDIDRGTVDFDLYRPRGSASESTDITVQMGGEAGTKSGKGAARDRGTTKSAKGGDKSTGTTSGGTKSKATGTTSGGTKSKATETKSTGSRATNGPGRGATAAPGKAGTKSAKPAKVGADAGRKGTGRAPVDLAAKRRAKLAVDRNRRQGTTDYAATLDPTYEMEGAVMVRDTIAVEDKKTSAVKGLVSDHPGSTERTGFVVRGSDDAVMGWVLPSTKDRVHVDMTPAGGGTSVHETFSAARKKVERTVMDRMSEGSAPTGDGDASTEAVSKDTTGAEEHREAA